MGAESKPSVGLIEKRVSPKSDGMTFVEKIKAIAIEIIEVGSDSNY